MSKKLLFEQMRDFGERVLMSFPRQPGKVTLMIEEVSSNIEALGIDSDTIVQLRVHLFEEAITTTYQNNLYVLNGLHHCYEQLAMGFSPEEALRLTYQKYIPNWPH